MKKKLVDEFKMLKNNVSKYDYDYINEHFESIKDIDITNIYFRDIKKHSLLTLEEELVLGEDLKLFEELDIVVEESKYNNRMCAKIDLDLVFKLCCDNKYYDVIIKSLLLYFNVNEDIFYKELGCVISKYDKLASKLGRALNRDELKEYMQIDGIARVVLKDEDLLEQVNKYLKYKEAFDRFFCSNLMLVASIASKYKFLDNFLDLINIGNEALIIAINKYDVSLGYKFSTYATWWIVSNVREYVIDQRKMIKLSHHLKEKLLFIKRKICALEQAKQRNVTLSEIALELGISVSKLTEYLSYEENYKLLSLDMPVDKEDDYYLGDYLKSDICIENEAINVFLKDDVSDLLKCLDPRELEVISLRYGFCKENPDGFSFREIAPMLGVSHEMVRLIEQKAFKKLRKSSKKYFMYGSLKDYID